MEYTKKKHIILVALAITVIASVTLIAILRNQQERRFEPVPAIMIVQDITEHSISRYGYNWQGSFAPLPHEPFQFTTAPVNVIQGSTIEFHAKNASRQADYYEITVIDIAQNEIDGSGIVLERSRLDNDMLLVEFKKSNYSMFVAGYWITVDFYGQHTDTVTYGTIMNVS